MHDLANRMKKNYENRQRYYLTRRTPVIVRVDGRAFHTLTRHLNKPFDERFIELMRMAAHCVAGEMQGCKLVFVQSDEASFLLTDYDNLQTEPWFDYNIAKMVSILASAMSIAFNHLMGDRDNIGLFDSRAFNIPREEVANYFLWRAKDWQRNSVLMYAQSFFSHKQMHNKKQSDLHEMLHGIGKNWTTDLSAYLRNGWWCAVGEDGDWRSDILPNFESVNEIVKPFVVDLENET